MQPQYILAADYISLDQFGRPVVVGVLDRLFVKKGTERCALLAVMAAVKESDWQKIDKRRWVLEGTSDESPVPIPMGKRSSRF